MKKSIAGLALFVLSTLAWALPSLQQVEAEIQQGHYTQAETMMAEVVAAKPGSARAHYLYAELLAHDTNFAKAATEVAEAKRIDPKIGFTDPAKFNAFEATLQREQNPVPRGRASTERPVSSFAPATSAISAPVERSGVPGWVWLAALVAATVLLWRMFARKPAPANGFATAGGPAGYDANVNPNANGYGPMGGAPAARPGSGLLGTGLAVAGGVAGGMLLDEMLHRRTDGGTSNFGGFNPEGYQPSSADSAASELENRPIDFGNADAGGGDWDSGSIDSGDSGGGGWD